MQCTYPIGRSGRVPRFLRRCSDVASADSRARRQRRRALKKCRSGTDNGGGRRKSGAPPPTAEGRFKKAALRRLRFFEVGIEQFNVLFQFGKLPIPERDITRHPGFSPLFRLKLESCRKEGRYPCFHIADPESLQRVRLLLTNAYSDQERKMPGYALSVYGAFLQLIPILLENYCRTTNVPPAVHMPERLADCLDFMQRNFRRELSTTRLAAEARMSPASFVRHFRSATGSGPREYLIRMRLEEACILLRTSDLSISEIAAESGFPDSNYFSRLFKRKNGISPRKYRSLSEPG